MPLFLGNQIAMRQFAASAATIKSMSVKEVGDVLAQISVSEPNDPELGSAIDEFFRVNFRKISFEDAKYVANKLHSSDGSKKIQLLDDKFWIWETLEEATRPHLDELDADTLGSIYMGFVLNVRGSEEFHMIAQDRFRYHYI